MHRLRSIVAALAILLMAVPPVFDTFDTWDTGPELPIVGHNTETNLMIAGLGIGICLAVSSLAVVLLDWLTTLLVACLCAATPAKRPLHRRATEYLLLLFSPPPWSSTALRI